jgi:hypothetical protein
MVGAGEEKAEPPPQAASAAGLTKEVFTAAVKAPSGGKDLIDKHGGVKGLCRALGADPSGGLPAGFDDEARRAEYGFNYIKRDPIEPYLSLCLEGMKDPIMLLLLGSAIVQLVIWIVNDGAKGLGWLEPVAISVTILLVINVQAGVDYGKAVGFEKQQRKLDNTGEIPIMRGGVDHMALPKHLVVGDIIRVGQGDKIPADGVIVESNNVQVDESAMTGEPVLLPKSPDVESGGDWRMLSGTSIMFGEGKMLVIAVGEHSFAGQIMKAVNEQGKAEKSEGGGCCGGGNAEEDADAAPKPPPVKGGCCDMGAARMAEAEGLADKLGIMAVEIGKLGAWISTVTVIVKCVVWTIQEFALGSSCNLLIAELTGDAFKQTAYVTERGGGGVVEGGGGGGACVLGRRWGVRGSIDERLALDNPGRRCGGMLSHSMVVPVLLSPYQMQTLTLALPQTLTLALPRLASPRSPPAATRRRARGTIPRARAIAGSMASTTRRKSSASLSQASPSWWWPSRRASPSPSPSRSRWR